MTNLTSHNIAMVMLFYFLSNQFPYIIVKNVLSRADIMSILREINFDKFWVSKTAIVKTLETLTFDFFVKFSYQKLLKFTKTKIQIQL